MSMPDDVAEARKALAEGDFARARAHLGVARQEGVDHDVLAALREEIDEAEGAITRNSSKHLLWAGVVALAAYVVLSLRSPWHWGMAVWIPVAFVVVPACVGLLAGMSLPPRASAADRFKRAMALTATAMALYTAVGLFLGLRPLPAHDDSAQRLTVCLLVAVVYALAAGLVAGVAARFAGGRSK